MLNQMYRNLRETTDDACECSSWMDHHATGCQEVKPRQVCSHLECMETQDLVGAHVYWYDEWAEQKPGVYIIPLCKRHNGVDWVYRCEVKPGTLFITTDRSVCREGIEKRQALMRALQAIKENPEDAFMRALSGQQVVHSSKPAPGVMPGSSKPYLEYFADYLAGRRDE